MDQSNQTLGENDEITLKELILKIQEFWKELWRNWILIILITIPFVGLFVFRTFSTPPTYSAEIRFIVEGEGGSSMGGLSGILGSFGIRKPGSTNPFKILEVARSKRLVSHVLFSKLEGKDTLVINKIIETYELDDIWAENFPEMKDLRFRHSSLDSLNELERKAFLSCYSKTVGNKKDRTEALYKIALSEEEGIFTISANSKNSDISYSMVNEGYDRIKFFFEEKTLEDKKASRDLLKTKADSIEALINYKSKALAKFEDRSRGLISNEQKLTRGKLLLEIEGLTTAFTEAIKSYEFADFNYRDSKPYFLAIDKPIRPIEMISPSLIVNIILGGVLGGFFAMFFVVIRKIYRDTMRG